MDLAAIFGAAVRHGATAIAGALVTYGVVSGTDTEWVIGAVVGIGGLVWSFIQKKFFADKLAAAKAAPAE